MVDCWQFSFDAVPDNMEENKDEYIRRMRQYNEEMNKVIEAVTPIVATSMKTKFILTPKPPNGAKDAK